MPYQHFESTEYVLKAMQYIPQLALSPGPRGEGPSDEANATTT